MPMIIYKVYFECSSSRGFWGVVTGVVEAFTDMEVNCVFNVGRKSVYAVSSNFDKFAWVSGIEGSM